MSKRTTYGTCRCCSAKGNHKDIMKEYYMNGIREVYYDMFMECFNLFLSTDPSLTCLICSSCIQQLREANSFRMMVVATERQLLSHITSAESKETLFVNVPPAPESLNHNVTIKTEYKEESDHEYGNYSEDMQDMQDDVPPEIDKEIDLVDGESEFLARFPLQHLKPLPTRESLYRICPDYVKHLDTMQETIVTPSMIAVLTEKKIKKTLPRVYLTEKMVNITNAATLIQCSNITPFRSKSRSGFPCFYCSSTFDTLDKIREHTLDHKKDDVTKILNRYGAECMVVYADVTDLKCTICNNKVPNLNELKSHLIKVHNKKIYTDYTDRVIPFKLANDNVYQCQSCGFNFETFGAIERHMNTHYRNYVCHECGAGFITKYRLKVHGKSMHAAGNFPCEVCKKVFTSQQKHKNHVDAVHKLLKRFKCTKCPERFNEYFRRQKHMVEVHGVAPVFYKCNVCDKSFERRYTLSRHLKRDHLEERDYQCELCSYKCFTSNELRVHMVKHNGERIYECSVCKKSYARKKTLKEHMRIHNNDRRFACAVCGQAFVQKCSLKGHLKTHHHEYSMQMV
ncbi:zinc finger protein 480-like [Plodia interpunctella]|uniref:zinc finger protein 480-like n=1 Tax=Plodia interpunctella TaxID=58824 RepID=UPI0023681DAE|nr:zinc finger protein 480-like [Plodia interpunctella]